MPAKATQEETVSSKIFGRWEKVAQKLTDLADAIPEKAFDFKPGGELRTSADVLRHVAFWNHYVADSLIGKKVDDSANELPKAKYATKAQVMDALKQSFADVSDAVQKNEFDLSAESAELLVTFIEHNCEHYGQLVVHARLNGIVPPASRT